MSEVKLFQGDCLVEMDKLIREGQKVDLILCDLPYGTTACKWDNIIPFEPMWECINQLVKDNAPILLFGTEPFSSHLRLSNIKNYKYDWIWIKDKGTNIFSANKRPMKNTEIISVFYKTQPFYNPVMRKGKPYTKIQKSSMVGSHLGEGNKKASDKINETGERFPLSTVYFARDTAKGSSFHPTQKPVKLLEYLIKTYTKEGDLVLDFTMGSGSTGVACMETNRNFIGIELEPKYYEIAEQRIKEAKAQRRLI